MNKTYANIILFIIVVLVFCIAAYLYVNDNNKKVIEKFSGSDSDTISLSFAYTNEEDVKFRYQVNFSGSELGNLSQRPFKLFNNNYKITLFEEREVNNTSATQIVVSNDDTIININNDMFTIAIRSDLDISYTYNVLRDSNTLTINVNFSEDYEGLIYVGYIEENVEEEYDCASGVSSNSLITQVINTSCNSEDTICGGTEGSHRILRHKDGEYIAGHFFPNCLDMQQTMEEYKQYIRNNLNSNTFIKGYTDYESQLDNYLNILNMIYSSNDSYKLYYSADTSPSLLYLSNQDTLPDNHETVNMLLAPSLTGGNSINYVKQLTDQPNEILIDEDLFDNLYRVLDNHISNSNSNSNSNSSDISLGSLLENTNANDISYSVITNEIIQEASSEGNGEISVYQGDISEVYNLLFSNITLSLNEDENSINLSYASSGDTNNENNYPAFVILIVGNLEDQSSSTTSTSSSTPSSTPSSSTSSSTPSSSTSSSSTSSSTPSSNPSSSTPSSTSSSTSSIKYNGINGGGPDMIGNSNNQIRTDTVIFSESEPLSLLQREYASNPQVNEQVARLRTGCSGRLSCDIDLLGREVQSVNCNCLEDFVGNNVREDLPRTISTPSGVDYSWGANF